MNLFIYVEGQEEEMFVNRVLRGHLSSFCVVVQKPVLAATSMLGTGQRGGFTSWPAVEADLRILSSTDLIGPHRHLVAAFVSNQIPAVSLPTDVMLNPHPADFKATGLRVPSLLVLKGKQGVRSPPDDRGFSRWLA